MIQTDIKPSWYLFNLLQIIRMENHRTAANIEPHVSSADIDIAFFSCRNSFPISEELDINQHPIIQLSYVLVEDSIASAVSLAQIFVHMGDGNGINAALKKEKKELRSKPCFFFIP